jgi:stage V sporulation protein G
MSQLQITQVSIRPYNNGDEKLRAFAAIIFNDCFIVKDLKVIEGHQGRFVAMPSRRGKDGVFRDVCHPLNQEMRDIIERTVLEKYEQQAALGFPDAANEESDSLAY